MLVTPGGEDGAGDREGRVEDGAHLLPGIAGLGDDAGETLEVAVVVREVVGLQFGLHSVEAGGGEDDAVAVQAHEALDDGVQDMLALRVARHRLQAVLPEELLLKFAADGLVGRDLHLAAQDLGTDEAA